MWTSIKLKMLEWNLNCKGIVKEYNSCKNELHDIYIYMYIYIYIWYNIVECIIVGSKIQWHYEGEKQQIFFWI